MRYQLKYEPMYAYECIIILSDIINNKSIADELKDTIERRGNKVKPFVEPLFQKAITLGEYFKQNINFAVCGYEDNGHELAELLFRKWEQNTVPPISVIIAYDSMLQAGYDNKAAAILGYLSEYCFIHEWSGKGYDAKNPPPQIDNKTFFNIINNVSYLPEIKLKAIQLLYNFELYQDYTHTILHHAELLLKSKMADFTDEIKSLMDYLDEQLKIRNGVFIYDKFGFSITDEQMYIIYPSIYQVNSLSMVMTGFSDPCVLFGQHIIAITDIIKDLDSNNADAADFLKCLSDSTKQAILQLLKEGPLYGSQLAEKLGCTNANISHHMSTLLKVDVVQIRKENNKVYYSLNKEGICQRLEDAKGLFV